jgi:hypothetical protein
MCRAANTLDWLVCGGHFERASSWRAAECVALRHGYRRVRFTASVLENTEKVPVER